MQNPNNHPWNSLLVLGWLPDEMPDSLDGLEIRVIEPVGRLALAEDCEAKSYSDLEADQEL